MSDIRCQMDFDGERVGLGVGAVTRFSSIRDGHHVYKIQVSSN